MESEEEGGGRSFSNVGSYKVKKRSCKVKKTPTSQHGVKKRKRRMVARRKAQSG
jgi:hypothetical protein